LLQTLSLGAVLYGLWLLLSGHYQPLLLGLGVASTIVVVLIARRMDLIDREGHPIHLSWRFLLYLPWLGWEIVKANIDIARVIVRPKMVIGPTVLRLKGTQKSELGHVIYANSITLTPGTVTIGLEEGVLSVHALTREAAEGLISGDMDRRVTAVEGAADGRGEHGV
jgi:multicomponent Na+:H+ antiporter subunit E